MKNLGYLLIALCAFVLSCEREEIKPEPKVLASFSAVAESPAETKVSIDADFVLSWEAGDKIKVWDGSVENLFVADESGRTTTFEAEGVVLVDDDSYMAAYPESLASFTSDALTVCVPAAVQTDPGVFPAAPAVASGTGKDRELLFHNVCGLVSFDIVGNDIKSVTIEGGNSEVLAGYVAVDALTGEYDAATITEPAASMTLTGLLTVLYPGKYYIPMLPQNFEKGMVLKMHTMNGSTIERTFEAFDLKRSYYHDLEGVDVGQYFRYEISTAEELQQFLTDAKDCKSHVVATLLRDIELKDVELTPAETFAGTFNGNGKSLKNWTAKSPLFTELADGGVVRNLTVASSCTYAFSEDFAPQAFIVGRNNGLVTACTNKASVSYTLSSDPSEAAMRTFGTIVGECLSKMTDCVNLGNIDIILAAQTGAQHIGGVAGTFCSAGSSAVENCTNEGNITVVSQLPHNVNVGGVCAQGCNSVPVSEADAQAAGAVKGCTNKGRISLTASSSVSNVGGVIGYVEGDVNSCVNEGEVVLKSYDAQTMSAPAVGGVAGTVVAGSVSGSSNAAQVTLEGAVQAATELAAYTGGNVDPAVGGVVAKAGKSVENTSLKIDDSVNSGAVNVKVTGAAVVNMGGIVGWTSNPVTGSGANTLLNNGPVTVMSSSEMSEVNVGGVLGQSISTFDKIYNSQTGTVTVSLPDVSDCVARVAGVAGYMSAVSDNSTFKQGNNKGAVNMSGGQQVTSTCLVAGVVAETKAKKVTSNNTSWDTSNSNYGDITVDAPVKLIVGGTLGRIGALTGGDGGTTRCKNRGNITVKSPAAGSCIGGVVGVHGRGKLGDANNCGVADDPVVINVTDASSDVYVGGYVGQVNTNNGPNYPSCCTTISGFGIYGSISASGATAGVIAGNIKMTGKSTTNGIMITSSGQNVRIAKNFQLNGTEVGDLTKNTDLSTFVASITPSTETTKTKNDTAKTPLKGIYYICSYGGTAESEFPYGFTNY